MVGAEPVLEKDEGEAYAWATVVKVKECFARLERAWRRLPVAENSTKRKR
jgi:hypothetical protein